MNTAKIPAYIKSVYILLLIIIIIFFMVMAKPILVPLVISGYIDMLLTSSCNWLERRKVSRSISASVCLLIFIFVLSGLLLFIYSMVSVLANDLGGDSYDTVNNYVIEANAWFDKH